MKPTSIKPCSLSPHGGNARETCRAHIHLDFCHFFVRLQYQTSICTGLIPLPLFKLRLHLLALLEAAQGLAGGPGRAADMLQYFVNAQLYSLSDSFFDDKLSVIFNLFSGFCLTLDSATARWQLSIYGKPGLKEDTVRSPRSLLHGSEVSITPRSPVAPWSHNLEKHHRLEATLLNIFSFFS